MGKKDTKVNFKINGPIGAAQKAVEATAQAIFDKADEIIATPGYFDSTPKDIIETGRLRRNQKLIKINNQQSAIKNATPYAEGVRAGFISRSGRFIEGRDWNKAAADEVLKKGVSSQSVRSLLK